MEFEFDEDQRLLRQMVRETVSKSRSQPEDRLWATYQELGSLIGSFQAVKRLLPIGV